MFDSNETSEYFLNFDQPLSKLLAGREIGDIIEATDNILFTEIFNNILPFGQKWWVDAERCVDISYLINDHGFRHTFQVYE